MTLVSDLLRLSSRRQSELLEDYNIAFLPHRNFPDRPGLGSSALVLEMELVVEHLQLFDENVVAAGNAIYAAHKAAEDRAAEAAPSDTVTDIEYLIADKLENLHDALIVTFQKAI